MVLIANGNFVRRPWLGWFSTVISGVPACTAGKGNYDKQADLVVEKCLNLLFTEND